MKHSGQDYSISLTGNVLSLSGKLVLSNYAEVDAFLREVDQAVSDSSFTIELQNLSFLNSSGIRSLATFILGSPKRFELRITPALTWQAESIPALQHLKPKEISIVSG